MCLFRWVKIVKGESKVKWKTKFSVFGFGVLLSVFGKVCKKKRGRGKRQEEIRIFILFFLLSGYEEKGTINFCVGVSDFF
ncbi:hypothetical protein BARVI_00175 [Barnesiella viscericola DSM 18177]|uniref:Uncharacterized protein n=1 Tax=Barnesiella viscericola DSM 18177 TaxID=880074 RepID=W0EWR6_9BACT|nr:hypothetical protein BARVI_00175 [Barnesiella viscericola DSM 18177]